MLETVTLRDGQLIIVPDSLSVTLWRNIISTMYMHPTLLVHPDLADLRGVFIENNVIHADAPAEIVIPFPELERAEHSLRPHITFPNSALQLIFGEISDFDISDSAITIRCYTLCATVKAAVTELAIFIRNYPRGLFTDDFGFVYDFLVRFGLPPKVIHTMLLSPIKARATSVQSAQHVSGKTSELKRSSNKLDDLKRQPPKKAKSNGSQPQFSTESNPKIPTTATQQGKRRSKTGNDSPKPPTAIERKKPGPKPRKSSLQKQEVEIMDSSIQLQRLNQLEHSNNEKRLSEHTAPIIGSSSAASECISSTHKQLSHNDSSSQSEFQIISNGSEQAKTMMTNSLCQPTVLPKVVSFDDYASKYKLRKCTIPIRDCRDDLQNHCSKKTKLNINSPKKQNGKVNQMTEVEIPLVSDGTRQLDSKPLLE